MPDVRGAHEGRRAQVASAGIPPEARSGAARYNGGSCRNSDTPLRAPSRLASRRTSSVIAPRRPRRARPATPRSRRQRISRRSSTPRSGPACGAKKGYVPRISLALLPPDLAPHPLRFERPLPLNPAVARARRAGGRAARHPPRRLAQRRPAICGLGHDADRSRPRLLRPRGGGARAARRQAPSGRGRQVRERRGARRRSGQDHRRAGVEPARLPGAAVIAARLRRRATRDGQPSNVLVSAGRLDARARPRRLAAGRARRTPTAGATSIVQPISYAVAPPFAELARARCRRAGRARTTTCAWQDALDDTVERDRRPDGGGWRDGLSPTATSCWRSAPRSRGATAHPLVEQVTVTEPIEGGRRGHRAPDAPRRHAAPVGGAVRPGSAGRAGARRLAGRPLHRLRVVAVRGDGPRAPRRDAAALNHGLNMRLAVPWLRSAPEQL